MDDSSVEFQALNSNNFTSILLYFEVATSHAINRTARTEIDQFGRSVLVEHDVIGFYISVANIVGDQPIDS
jgi:hypothetical protein